MNEQLIETSQRASSIGSNSRTAWSIEMRHIKRDILFGLWTITVAFMVAWGLSAQLSARPPQDEPFQAANWQVFPSEPLVPGQGFSLYTSPPGQFVIYGRREYGINLTWAKRKQQHDFGAPANFTLSRASGSDDPVRYGEAVALRETRGGYIYYKRRKYGINLEFSNQPSYEWEVRGGRIVALVTYTQQGDSPDSISDVVISLYNRRANCVVVYGTRQYGINLVWNGGPTC